MKKKILAVFCVALFLIIVGVWWALPKLDLAKRDTGKNTEAETELSVMNINLNDVTLAEIIAGDKNARYPGNEISISRNGSTSEYTSVELRGRGNTTWNTEKRPFRLKFRSRVDLLGQKKAKKWVLLANMFDDSHLRNDTALYVAGMLDPENALGGDFVKVKFDGSTAGVYYLVPMVSIGKEVVDLRDPQGVLVEVDNLHGMEEGCYFTIEGTCLNLKDAVNKEQQALGMQDFLEDFNRLEVAARKKDYDSIVDLVDVESFAKYFLLSEFTVNPDAYTSSWYMYKDGPEDKIHAGPGWDYDLALGNRNWVWNLSDDFYSPEADMIREADVMGGNFIMNGRLVEHEGDAATSKLFYHLMKIPEFKEVVCGVYQAQMAGRKNELLARIKQQIEKISEEAMAEEERYEKGDYNEEVEYLLDWVSRRYDHFEEVYGGGKILAMPVVL